MSNTKGIKVDNVDINDALIEIKGLSNGEQGLILNKKSMEGLSNVLSGTEKNIENVAGDPSASKVININQEPKISSKPKNNNKKQQVKDTKNKPN